MTDTTSLYEPLFKLAFEQGCGIPYEDALRAPRFEFLLNRELTIYDRFPSNSHERQILDIGVHSASFSANQVARDKNGSQAFRFNTYGPAALRERALIQFLGESLVASAEHCLPDKALAMAHRWHQEGEVGREQLLVDLYNYFAEIGLARSVEYREAERNNPFYPMSVTYDIKDVLPCGFGRYDELENHLPSCLGVAQLLVAWARRCNALVLGASLLTDFKAVYWELERNIATKVLRAIKKQRLPASKELLESLRSNIVAARAYRQFVSDSHTGIAISTGRAGDLWYYVDPYSGAYGNLQHDDWEMEIINEATTFWSDIQPGITVTGNDRGFLKRWIAERRVDIDEAIWHADNLEFKLQQIPLDDRWCDTIEALPEIAYLSSITSTERLAGHRLSIYLLCDAFGWKIDPGTEAWAEAWSQLQTNEKYRRLIFGRICTLLIRSAKKRYHYLIEHYQPSTFRAPVGRLEFFIPEFQLALRVLNNLRIWWPVRGLPGSWFLKHSSSQLLWHQANLRLKDEILSEESEILLGEAEKTVRSLRPDLHRAVELMLRSIDETRGKEVR